MVFILVGSVGPLLHWTWKVHSNPGRFGKLKTSKTESNGSMNSRPEVSLSLTGSSDVVVATSCVWSAEISFKYHFVLLCICIYLYTYSTHTCVEVLVFMNEEEFQVSTMVDTVSLRQGPTNVPWQCSGSLSQKGNSASNNLLPHTTIDWKASANQVSQYSHTWIVWSVLVISLFPACIFILENATEYEAGEAWTQQVKSRLQALAKAFTCTAKSPPFVF